jgi:hypothetical protein
MTRETPPMMGCGHAANSIDTKTGAPSCAICVGIHPGADTIVTGYALNDRMMSCCGAEVPSDPKAAFFQHRPTKATDSFYCGHAGWD